MSELVRQKRLRSRLLERLNLNGVYLTLPQARTLAWLSMHGIARLDEKQMLRGDSPARDTVRKLRDRCAELGDPVP